MWLSRVLLRWYKSFNSLNPEKPGAADAQRDWNNFRGDSFPFIAIGLDRRITTIVGANEAGKSHLLSGLAKGVAGQHAREEETEEYALPDICRYCDFDGLDDSVWPQVGVEITLESDEECAAFRKEFNVETVARGAVTVIVDGGADPKRYASLYTDSTQPPDGFLDRDKWHTFATSHLPEIRFIEANVAFSNEIHVRQLVQMYHKKRIDRAFDPIALHDLADRLVDLKLTTGKAPSAEAVQTYESLCADIKQTRTLGPSKSGTLETLLFRDVLDVEERALAHIADVGASERGFVERLVAEINHRITERLNLSDFWQQDPDFRLQVNYKGGFFHFEITDRTGVVYTFNERSSGLQYFLSYFIQALAIQKTTAARGAVILMDEPDGYLSAAGQRNLLSVFDLLVDAKRGGHRFQLVYTTHSPFLINRNYPSRIRLVRKGDGSEGTQVVENAIGRRYEPVRSALGVDYADTLFVGASNVVVEGASDQRLIVASVQAFGDPSDVERLLNLNRVTMISAGGSTNVRRVVERSAGSEMTPVVVVMLDADIPGNEAYQELVANEILPKQFVSTIDSCVEVPGTRVQVLEDVVPTGMLACATARYLENRWGITDVPNESIESILADSDSGSHAGARLAKILRDHLSPAANEVPADELKAGVVEQLADDLAAEPERIYEEADVEAMGKRMTTLCKSISTMLDAAESHARRRMMNKQMRLITNAFLRTFKERATRADVERWLTKLEVECADHTPEAKRASQSMIELKAQLNDEVASADVEVDLSHWRGEFERIRSTNW